MGDRKGAHLRGRDCYDDTVLRWQAPALRVAMSVRQVTHDQMGLGPTGSDTRHSWFLLSLGCNRSRYYCAPHGTGLIPNETQFPLPDASAMSRCTESIASQMSEWPQVSQTE